MSAPATMSQVSHPVTDLTAFFLRAHVRFHRPTDVSRLSHFLRHSTALTLTRSGRYDNARR